MAAPTVRRAVASLLFARSPTDETSGRVMLSELGLEHPDRQSYIPSAWWVLRWLLPVSDVNADDVLVEFGCGKGRIVLDAARRYQFSRVVGVELSPELSDVARSLVSSSGRLRCPDVRIETADATQFEIPDDVTFAYMFNPFTGDVFQSVLDNIVASLERAPRRLRLIYVNPICHDQVIATNRFRCTRMVHTSRLVSLVRAGIYESVGVHALSAAGSAAITSEAMTPSGP
jgi:SAM-dependent methyltransferase